MKDGTILSFGCHHYFSDGHGFSLLGQRFSQWLKGIKPPLFDHVEMSIDESIYSSLNFFSTETIIKRYTKKYLFEKFHITNQDKNLSLKLPNIDENCFSNCTLYICLSFSMNDLTNLTIKELSQKINIDKQKFMTSEYLQSASSYSNNSFNRIDLSFTNWSRFPLYKCDFGQGQGKSFKISEINFDGLILILPTSNQDEIELHITLNHQHAQLLRNRLV